MGESAEQPLPEIFEGIRDKDETIYWAGKPNALCFMLPGVGFVLGGLVWGLIAFFFSSAFFHVAPDSGGLGSMRAFVVVFFFLFSFPCWGSFLLLAYLWLAHSRTFYAYSNRRLMIRSGAIGTSTQTFDYDSISNLDVTVGPIEGMLGAGSIRFNTGRTNVKGFPVFSCFKAIREPYEVFKKIKETAMDIKTDEYYPNALRPEENPGYHSKYKSGKSKS